MSTHEFTDDWQPGNDKGFLPRCAVTYFGGADSGDTIAHAVGTRVRITVHVSDRGHCSYDILPADVPGLTREVRYNGRVSTPIRAEWRIHNVDDAHVFLERVTEGGEG